jgi:hypothetical protein
MPASSARRSDDEIIADIIKETGKKEMLKPVSASELAEYRLSIKALCHKLIDDLRKDYPPLAGYRKQNVEWTRDLHKKITAVKKKLAASNPLLAPIFAPERFWSLWPWQGTAVEIDAKARDYITQKPERLAQLLAELDRICAECDHIISLNANPRDYVSVEKNAEGATVSRTHARTAGRHASVGHQQERAAIASRAVMEFCGRRRGKPLSCSRSSVYCKVAALFYEAVSGKHGQDLLRACQTVARDPLGRRTAS